MKRNLILFIVAISLAGCKSYWFNMALEMVGAYDESVSLTALINEKEDKTVVFIPMVHYSTELFYKDVIVKIDSLQKEGFYFYFEGMGVHTTDTTSLRKLRKIMGVPVAHSAGDSAMDSLLISKKVKTKKKLVTQPPNSNLGFKEGNSRNVDSSVLELTNHYEELYGEIVLNDCDFATKVTEASSCPKQKRDRERYDSIILDYRNNLVLQEIFKEKDHKKIAVIYGKGHVAGIEKALLQEGYTIKEN